MRTFPFTWRYSSLDSFYLNLWKLQLTVHFLHGSRDAFHGLRHGVLGFQRLDLQRNGLAERKRKMYELPFTPIK